VTATFTAPPARSGADSNATGESAAPYRLRVISASISGAVAESGSRSGSAERGSGVRAEGRSTIGASAASVA
jgi:hypothetical protein